MELEPQGSVPENCQVMPEGFQKAQGRAEAAQRGLTCQISQKRVLGRPLPGLETKAQIVVDLLTRRVEEGARSDQRTGDESGRMHAREKEESTTGAQTVTL